MSKKKRRKEITVGKDIWNKNISSDLSTNLYSIILKALFITVDTNNLYYFLTVLTTILSTGENKWE